MGSDAKKVESRTNHAKAHKRRALLIGSSVRSGFCRPLTWLRENYVVQSAATVETAMVVVPWIQHDPDVIVLIQEHPNQHGFLDTVKLLHAFPLSTSVLLYGSCCEGETRNGQPLPTHHRFAWYDFEPRMAALDWDEPFMVADENRWQDALHRQLPQCPMTIGVLCGAHDTAATHREMLLAAGHSTTRLVLDEQAVRDLFADGGFDLLLWDDAADIRSKKNVLPVTAADYPFPGMPVVVLTTFPRPQLVDFLLDSGALAVLPKPFFVPDLLWHIERNRGAVGH